ncbi:hypothetical protein REPUB_Repub08aG0028900 [Reevesia pubescens]
MVFESNVNSETTSSSEFLLADGKRAIRFGDLDILSNSIPLINRNRQQSVSQNASPSSLPRRFDEAQSAEYLEIERKTMVFESNVNSETIYSSELLLADEKRAIRFGDFDIPSNSNPLINRRIQPSVRQNASPSSLPRRFDEAQNAEYLEIERKTMVFESNVNSETTYSSEFLLADGKRAIRFGDFDIPSNSNPLINRRIQPSVRQNASPLSLPRRFDEGPNAEYLEIERKTMVFESNLNSETTYSSEFLLADGKRAIRFGDFVIPLNSNPVINRRIQPSVRQNASPSSLPRRFDEAQNAEYLEIEKKGVYYTINHKDTDLYLGFLTHPIISGKKHVSFLPFIDKQEAIRMYNYLMSSNNECVVKCYEIFSHQDKEWLVAVEPIEPIESYFMRKVEDWQSNFCQGSIVVAKANWWSYIGDDFINISRNIKSLFCTLLEDERFIKEGIIYTSNLEQSIMIAIADNRVKFLPNGKANKCKAIDIDKMQRFLSHFIGLPFGLNDVAGDSDFKLSNELISFLHNLSSENLKFVGPKFLLGASLGWHEIDGYRFIINLDDLLKRNVIEMKLLNDSLQRGHEATKWASNLANYPVLFAIYNFPRFSNGTVATYVSAVDVVRYCSNVYRHYNDENYKRHRIKCLGKLEIEKELKAAIPDLYVNLYNALLLYAKKKARKQEAIFEKLLSSEDL